MKKAIYRFLCCIPFVGSVFRKKNRVSVVRMQGVIMPESGGLYNRKHAINFENIDGLLEKAYSVPNVRAVALVINSPGGTPVQSALIAERILELAKRHKVKTYAFVEDVAASGGYWLACAADEIYTHKASIVGSIGVISAGFGFDKLIKKHGIDRRVYTAGQNKNMLDSFAPEDPQEVKRLKALQKELHEQFIDWVKVRRGKKLVGTDKKLFTGDVWTGSQAFDLGLVDGCEDMKRMMRKKYGQKVKFVEFQESKGFFASLLSRGNVAPKSFIDIDDALSTLSAWDMWSYFLNK